jgi:hypothetical protein
VTGFVAAGAGFLLAVLWFDLMFDVQARRHGDRDPSEAALDSISAYYARVTTTARPMNRLVATVMLGTLAALVLQLVRGDEPRWVASVSLLLAGAAIALAGTRTFPNAVRLGARADPVERRSALARSILHDHVMCLGAIATVLVLQLGFAR